MSHRTNLDSLNCEIVTTNTNAYTRIYYCEYTTHSCYYHINDANFGIKFDFHWTCVANGNQNMMSKSVYNIFYQYSEFCNIHNDDVYSIPIPITMNVHVTIFSFIASRFVISPLCLFPFRVIHYVSCHTKCKWITHILLVLVNEMRNRARDILDSVSQFVSKKNSINTINGLTSMKI